MKKMSVATGVMSFLVLLALSLGAGFAEGAEKMMDKGTTVKEGEMMMEKETGMKKEGDMMKKEGDMMKKEGDMMKKEGDMMKKEGDMMKKEGDMMK